MIYFSNQKQIVDPSFWDTFSWMTGCVLEADPDTFFKDLKVSPSYFSFYCEPLDLVICGTHYTDKTECDLGFGWDYDTYEASITFSGRKKDGAEAGEYVRLEPALVKAIETGVCEYIEKQCEQGRAENPRDPFDKWANKRRKDDA